MIGIAPRRTPTNQLSRGTPWADLLGSLGVTDRLNLLRDAGYGFHVSVGAVTTPIVGGGNGTVLDPEQAEYAMNVPTGTAIYLARAAVEVQTPLLATDADECEILLAADVSGTLATITASTGTVETVFGMRTDKPVSSNCTVVSANTSDHNPPTLGMEIDRAQATGDMNGTPANALWGILKLLYEPRIPICFVGPCSVFIYWGGTVATPGFAQVEWIELQGDAYTAILG